MQRELNGRTNLQNNKKVFTVNIVKGLFFKVFKLINVFSANKLNEGKKGVSPTTPRRRKKEPAVFGNKCLGFSLL